MLIQDKTERRKFKKDLKRRLIEVAVSVPFGVGFAVLFWWLNLSVGLQLFLTVVCWGALIGIVELIGWGISKKLEEKRAAKPNKRDPFAD